MDNSAGVDARGTTDGCNAIRPGIAPVRRRPDAGGRPRGRAGHESVRARRAREDGRGGHADRLRGAFRAPRPTRILTLALGYADGLPRAAGGGRVAVAVRSGRAPIVGRVSCDLATVAVPPDDPSGAGRRRARVRAARGASSARRGARARRRHDLVRGAGAHRTPRAPSGDLTARAPERKPGRAEEGGMRVLGVGLGRPRARARLGDRQEPPRRRGAVRARQRRHRARRARAAPSTCASRAPCSSS